MILPDFPRYLFAFCATLWVGGTWVVGYVVVPVLFKVLSDRQLAGNVAGSVFTVMAYTGLMCALYLLTYQIRQHKRAIWKRGAFIVTLSMLILLVIGQFVIQPMMADLKAQALPFDVMQSQLSGQFKALHGVASIFYLMQSLLGIALVTRFTFNERI